MGRSVAVLLGMLLAACASVEPSEVRLAGLNRDQAKLFKTRHVRVDVRVIALSRLGKGVDAAES